VATTISNTVTVGVTLSTPSQNPVTVAATGYVTNQTTVNFGDAVYGGNAAAWNFTNLGTVKGAGTASTGVRLTSGGGYQRAERFVGRIDPRECQRRRNRRHYRISCQFWLDRPGRDRRRRYTSQPAAA
jgi:hypothetical protein